MRLNFNMNSEKLWESVAYEQALFACRVSCRLGGKMLPGRILTCPDNEVGNRMAERFNSILSLESGLWNEYKKNNTKSGALSYWRKAIHSIDLTNPLEILPGMRDILIWKD